MANYNLIEGLFAKQSTSRASSTSSASLTSQASGYTKRTWKISDKHWEEFVALATLSKKTQADLINDLNANAVEEKTKEISEYLKFFSKHK